MTGIEIFVAVARYGTMREAAKQFGIRPSAVSYQLKVLEERLGTRLFERTTRNLKLTEGGHALYSEAVNGLTCLENAFDAARTASQSKKGTVRLSLPQVAYDMLLAKHLSQFQKKYPDIILELSFNDAFVDITESNFHAGIRMEEHIPGSMISHRICPPFKEVFFASPDYFLKNGIPRHPADLKDHNCVRYRFVTSKRLADWRFDIDGRITTISVSGNLIVDSTSAWVDAARHGSGIAWLFEPAISEFLNSGELQSVLDKYAIRRNGYHIYYPRSSLKLEPLRLLVSFLKSAG